MLDSKPTTKPSEKLTKTHSLTILAMALASAHLATVNANDTVDFTSAALASAAQSAIGGSIFLLAKLDVEDTTQRNIFRFNASNLATGKPTLTIDYIPEPSTALLGGLGML